MGLFDSPWHILIVLVVLVVLFGSTKLPKAAKSMGEAMRIFKKETAKLHEEDPSAPQQVQASAPQQVAAPQPQVTPQQQQMAALQQQMDALKQQMGSQQPAAQQPATPGPLPETQHTNQSTSVPGCHMGTPPHTASPTRRRGARLPHPGKARDPEGR